MEYLKEIYKIKTEDFEEDSYLRNIPSLKNFQGLKIEKPVTFFVGENGSGDSDIMMTDTINPLKSKFKGFHKTFKQDDLGLSLSSFLLN
ncbi:hypothetical protein [Peptoniphilus harei]|uniref:Rad50/SbcC-type AAA domain-containing protein n=1 Tax=Peptoniphilus harei TaxID=54005 RepID=A0A2X1Y111_9FIRM|nr:hypothetical protein [Peptoniphilus harei]SPY48677.1 Uncharacterised protein [Peptoniphilus harei]